MTDILHFLSWYFLILVIGLLGFPIIFKLLPNLTSRGYALARPLGLLIWGFLFWLLGSLGILQNNLGGVLLALFLLAGCSIWCCLKCGWQDLLHWIKENKKTLIVMEVVFFVAFALWTVVRAANPDAAYTEKPMELAFINSLLRSPSIPPLDPWLSGYAISYYYFGYVIVSMLTRVSGVASSIAFNLSSALWFGLTALASYGIVFDLLAGVKKNPEHHEKRVKLGRVGGVLGPIFVLIVSCLEGFLEFLYSAGAFWKADSLGNLSSKFWTWLSISELDVPPAQPFTMFPSRTNAWLWWRGSRVIQDLSLTNTKIEVIDEFPFFSYLLSDLHPHLLAMPFGLLAVGICLNLFLGRKDFFTTEKPFFGWLKHWQFWLISLVLGSLAFINTWDFPIYVGLFCLVIIYLRAQEKGWNWTRLWELIKYAFLIGVTGVVLFLPFYLGFRSQAGGILPSMEFMTRGIHFWILFGALLFPMCVWLVFQVWGLKKPRRLLAGFRNAYVVFGVLLLVSLLFGILILNADQTGMNMLSSSNQWVSNMGAKISSAAQAFANLHGTNSTSEVVSQALIRRAKWPVTWLTLFSMLALVWTLLARRKESQPADEVDVQAVENNPSNVFVYILILLGICLTAFPEFFYLRDQFGWRMNTIFKFYFQAWILWGIAAAYASVDLFTRLKSWKNWLFSFFWVLLIGASLAYPAVMLWQKTDKFKPVEWTLDGNAYLARYNQDDYAAIQWLSQQPLGVVSEAIGGSYSEYARVSTRSGMPTVLGWPGHEGQWRGGYTEVGTRETDIATLYSSSDWSETLLMIQRYDIRYVYLGTLEKNLYQANVDKFRANLPVVYENGSVVIFEVPDSEGGITP